MSITESSIHTLLGGLQKLTFHDQRFLKPVAGLYDALDPSAAPYAFISSLVEHLPENQQQAIVATAMRKFVSGFDHCPSPKDVRLTLAESAVWVIAQLDFSGFADFSRRLVSLPPTDPAAGDDWKVSVAYSAVSAIGRDRFASVTPEEWAAIVTDVIFGDRPMVRYAPKVKSDVPVVPRKFSDLIHK